MKKVLSGLFLILSIQTIHADVEEKNSFTAEEYIENIQREDLSRSKLSRKPRDILADLVGRHLESSQGADILPDGEIRTDFQFTLKVLTADSKLGVYRVQIKTSSPRFPGVKDEDIFVIGRVGEDYFGHGTQIGQGAQEIFIRRVGKNLEVTISDIYDLLFQTPFYAQQRAIFPLPRQFR